MEFKRDHKLYSLLDALDRDAEVILEMAYPVHIRDGHFAEVERVLDHWLLFYVTKGNVIYRAGEEEIRLRDYSLVMVPPGMPHQAIRMKESELRSVVLRFSISPKPCIDIQDDVPFFYKDMKPGFFGELFYLAQLASSHRHFAPVRFRSCLHAIIQKMVQLHLGDIDSKDVSAFEKLIQFMQANPADRSSVQALADRAALSKRKLNDLFLEQYGVATKQFQILCRINHATMLMEETAMNIREISEVLGYPDQFSFSKQFKATVGYSPDKVKAFSLESN